MRGRSISHVSSIASCLKRVKHVQKFKPQELKNS